MSNSVRFFVPAPQSCGRVLAFLLHPRCVSLVTRPRNEGAGGAPGGVLPVVALVGRDATRKTGTPPLGAPPWRCRPRNRSGRANSCDPASRLLTASHCSWRATAPGFSFHGSTGRDRRHSPLRLLDRLRRRPS